MANALYSLSMIDYAREPSSFRVHTPQLDAVTVLTIAAEIATFEAAVAGISGGTFSSHRFMQIDDKLSNTPPTNPVYQRENKWLVTYQDNVNHQIFRTQIPCANLSLLAGNSEFLDITTALSPGNVFKLAFELFCVSEDGNAITVISVQNVGRDL